LDFDDIVIGSGLSALGTAIGLPPTRRTLVLCGPEPAQTQFYDVTRAVPCAHLGYGGLGNYWHGVIPTGALHSFASHDAADFELLFHRFYPDVEIASRLGKPFLFVPWRAIRPRAAWARLLAERPGRLELVHEPAQQFELAGRGVQVRTGSECFRARRVWICSGALQTPALLDRSLGQRVSRATVSDHVLIYVGQVDRADHPHVRPPPVERTRSGLWLDARYNEAGTGLFTMRPARFAYRRLDFGIEQRAAFGLPMSSALAKILRCTSAGLLAEALYNRLGLFANSRVQSVYAQLVVPDAHWLRDDTIAPLQPRVEVIQAAIDAVRASPVWPQALLSRRPDMFLPVIHLHHSVDGGLLAAAGLNGLDSAVQVMDASPYEHVGPEHHSFGLMAAAFAKARASA
jgi:hypothetical protein